MDGRKIGNDISNVLQEFKNLLNAYEEGKQARKELTEFVALLREELKLARDAEKTAEMKKIRCQGYVSQQQEVILQLLSVKEENENLKQTNYQMESIISDIQNNSMAEHVKMDAQVHNIKQEYLAELIKIQQASDDQVAKVKAELDSTMEELRSTISKNEETIEQQTKTVQSLQSEVEDLKKRAEVNLDIFQKKLAEQERKHQAELETWKLAELNQSLYPHSHSILPQYGSYPCPPSPYQPSNVFRQLPEYQQNMPAQKQSTPDSQMNTYSTIANTVQHSPYLNRPLVSRCRSVLSRGAPNIVRPLPPPKSTDFVSANDFFLQNHVLTSGDEKDKDENSSDGMTEQQTTINVNHINKTVGQKLKVPVSNKRRKLFNSNQNFL